MVLDRRAYSVPVEINIFLEHSNTLGLLRFLRMFRLLRLLRLLKIEEYIETLENQFDINLRILRVVFMLVKICFLSHILGCFWYYTAAGAAAAGEETTWTNSYDDGRIAQEGMGLGTRYLYSVYWAVTTLTTVGYGDIVPTNDRERLYALCAMLVSALVFGYMISNIGSLVASMDRQAALVEEKTDAVKEYVTWRGLPRDLALRVKKHYAFYYTQRAAFDEIELLDGLSPSLRSEVTRFVLRETLGKLPLFTQQLDPEFQLEVFPSSRSATPRARPSSSAASPRATSSSSSRARSACSRRSTARSPPSSTRARRSCSPRRRTARRRRRPS